MPLSLRKKLECILSSVYRNQWHIHHELKKKNIVCLLLTCHCGQTAYRRNPQWVEYSLEQINQALAENIMMELSRESEIHKIKQISKCLHSEDCFWSCIITSAFVLLLFSLLLLVGFCCFLVLEPLKGFEDVMNN